MRHDGNAIGEIWYERPDEAAVDPSLLLKLLFTSQPLSIQVHPDDAFAHSMGLQNGKTEAWYVLSAVPEAQVALGLRRHLTPQLLREAIDDGSISDLIVWRAVSADDVIFVPAGTIHAIGAGLVIAELQQRSDATFRLFDYGQQARTSHRKRYRGGAHRAGRFSGAAEPAYRRTRNSLSPTRISSSNASIWRQIPIGVWKPNERLAARSERQRYSRVIRRCRGRCAFCAVRPHRHSHWRHRHGGPRRVHRRRPASTPAAASHATGSNQPRLNQ